MRLKQGCFNAAGISLPIHSTCLSDKVTALNHHFNHLLLFFKEPTMAFILLLLWIGASIVIGKLAQASGRSFFIWFVISMLIDPIFGVILFAVVVRSK